MKFNKDNLLTNLKDKTVVIWGARMTGIGFLRFANKHNLNVIGFVDADPAYVGKEVINQMVYKPDKITAFKKQYDDLKVVVCASTKEDEIVNRLKKMRMAKSKRLWRHSCTSCTVLAI